MAAVALLVVLCVAGFFGCVFWMTASRYTSTSGYLPLLANSVSISAVDPQASSALENAGLCGKNGGRFATTVGDNVRVGGFLLAGTMVGLVLCTWPALKLQVRLL